MKANIHPKWHDKARVTCSCGNTFTIGATVPEINVEVCSNCHPFYTGQMKYLDAAGRVDAFKAKQKGAKKKLVSKSEKRRIKKLKRIKDELAKPDTLSELRKTVKKSKKSKKAKKSS